MPLIHDFAVTLSMDDVLRREEGTTTRKVNPRIQALVEELLARVEAESLLHTGIAYEVYSVAGVEGDRLRLASGEEFEGRFLVKRVAEAGRLAVAVCTIGPRLDEEVGEYFNQGDELRAMLLDGIGNAAVDTLSRETCQLIGHMAAEQEQQASSPMSPGLHGIDISNQSALFRLVPAGEIGVTLSTGGMMLPRKSVSMLIGLGERMPNWSKAQACDWCNLSRSCAYRVHA